MIEEGQETTMPQNSKTLAEGSADIIPLAAVADGAAEGPDTFQRVLALEHEVFELRAVIASQAVTIFRLQEQEAVYN